MLRISVYLERTELSEVYYYAGPIPTVGQTRSLIPYKLKYILALVCDVVEFLLNMFTIYGIPVRL